MSSQWSCINNTIFIFFLTDLYNLHKQCYLIHFINYILYYTHYIIYICYVLQKYFSKLILLANLFNFRPKKIPGFPCLLCIQGLILCFLAWQTGEKSVLKWACLRKKVFCGLLVFWRILKSTAFFFHRSKITHQTTQTMSMRLWKVKVTWSIIRYSQSNVCCHPKKNSFPWNTAG